MILSAIRFLTPQRPWFWIHVFGVCGVFSQKEHKETLRIKDEVLKDMAEERMSLCQTLEEQQLLIASLQTHISRVGQLHAGAMDFLVSGFFMSQTVHWGWQKGDFLWRICFASKQRNVGVISLLIHVLVSWITSLWNFFPFNMPPISVIGCKFEREKEIYLISLCKTCCLTM